MQLIDLSPFLLSEWRGGPAECLHVPARASEAVPGCRRLRLQTLQLAVHLPLQGRGPCLTHLQYRCYGEKHGLGINLRIKKSYRLFIQSEWIKDTKISYLLEQKFPMWTLLNTKALVDIWIWTHLYFSECSPRLVGVCLCAGPVSVCPSLAGDAGQQGGKG